MKWDRFVCYFADKTKKNSILLNANCVRMPWEINIYWNSILFLLLFLIWQWQRRFNWLLYINIYYTLYIIYIIFSRRNHHISIKRLMRLWFSPFNRVLLRYIIYFSLCCCIFVFFFFCGCLCELSFQW